MRLTFVCHPATVSMRQGRFPTDSEELDAQAVDALRRLASDRFADADCVVSSPLRRAAETVSLLGLTAVTEPALRDLSSGDWAGCALAELEPETLAAWLRDPYRAPPRGESIAGLRHRAAGWLATVPHLGRHVLAVTHPAVVRAVLLAAIEAPLHLDRLLDVAPLTEARLSWHRCWRVQGFGLPLQQEARR